LTGKKKKKKSWNESAILLGNIDRVIKETQLFMSVNKKGEDKNKYFLVTLKSFFSNYVKELLTTNNGFLLAKQQLG